MKADELDPKVRGKASLELKHEQAIGCLRWKLSQLNPNVDRTIGLEFARTGAVLYRTRTKSYLTKQSHESI